VDELAEPLVLQEVVFCEFEALVVDCVGFGTELGVNVEQTLEGFLHGKLMVELSQQSLALSERVPQFCLLVLVVWSFN